MAYISKFGNALSDNNFSNKNLKDEYINWYNSATDKDRKEWDDYASNSFLNETGLFNFSGKESLRNSINYWDEGLSKFYNSWKQWQPQYAAPSNTGTGTSNLDSLEATIDSAITDIKNQRVILREGQVIKQTKTNGTAWQDPSVGLSGNAGTEQVLADYSGIANQSWGGKEQKQLGGQSPLDYLMGLIKDANTTTVDGTTTGISAPTPDDYQLIDKNKLKSYDETDVMAGTPADEVNGTPAKPGMMDEMGDYQTDLDALITQEIPTDEVALEEYAKRMGLTVEQLYAKNKELFDQIGLGIKGQKGLTDEEKNTYKEALNSQIAQQENNYNRQLSGLMADTGSTMQYLLSADNYRRQIGDTRISGELQIMEQDWARKQSEYEATVGRYESMLNSQQISIDQYRQAVNAANNTKIQAIATQMNAITEKYNLQAQYQKQQNDLVYQMNNQYLTSIQVNNDRISKDNADALAQWTATQNAKQMGIQSTIQSITAIADIQYKQAMQKIGVSEAMVNAYNSYNDTITNQWTNLIGLFLMKDGTNEEA